MALGKAVNTQRFIRVSFYGPSGSGKTLTALICGEKLAKKEKARLAMWDSEHGSDFYTEAVSTRICHPAAFDFDADYDKSLSGVTKLVKTMDGKTHKVLIVDSMTHIWEAARNSYQGPVGEKGQIPIHAWGPIKARYKAVMDALHNFKGHVIIIGREGVEYGEDAEGKDGVIGKKMKAEAETEYEMNMSIRMERVGQKKRNVKFAVRAIVEKDRTGIMQGKVIVNPTFETLFQPMMRMLTAKEQGKVQTAAEVEQKDAEHFAGQDHTEEAKSLAIEVGLRKKINTATTLDQMKAIGKEIATKKHGMTPSDISNLKNLYLDVRDRIKEANSSEKQRAELLFHLEPLVMHMDVPAFIELAKKALHGRSPEWPDGYRLADLRLLKTAFQKTSPNTVVKAESGTQ